MPLPRKRFTIEELANSKKTISGRVGSALHQFVVVFGKSNKVEVTVDEEDNVLLPISFRDGAPGS